MISNLLKRIFTSFILIILLCFSLFYNDVTWKILIIIFLLLCFYEFYNLIFRIYKKNFFILLIMFLVGLYLFFFYFLLMKIKFEFGKEAILVLLIACFLSDIGGYITGKTVGGPKLSKISPNKTISGALGSIIFTLVGSSLFVFFLNKIDKNLFIHEFSILVYVWLIMMSIFCQVGDLFISYLKRKAKVKDTGNLLPGHGGILDRVDGIMFAIPFGVLTYFILHFLTIYYY